MAAVGGSIEEVSLQGRSFAVPADNEAQLDLGGYSNESQPNGNKTARLIKTAKTCKIDGLLVEISHANGDLEYLQAQADKKDFWPASITLADGSVYEAQMQIVGDLNGSTQSATASISLSGTLTMTRQV